MTGLEKFLPLALLLIATLGQDPMLDGNLLKLVRAIESAHGILG